MTVQRFVALGLAQQAEQAPDIPSPRLVADSGNTARVLSQLGLGTDLPAVAFMPGAEYGPAKQWPPNHFAQLAKDLIARGHQVWILGSAKDRAVGDLIAQTVQDKRLHNLCGQTMLGDVVDLLSVCHAAVSNDSGLMHVAAALDKPLVAIYGSSDPKHTPPLSKQAHVLYLGLPCSPCFERQCPLGHTRCLHDIQPDKVLQALS